MKVLTANFVTCAVKTCKSSPTSFPLHFHDAELEQQEVEYSTQFMTNILPRIEWDALRVTALEVRENILCIFSEPFSCLAGNYYPLPPAKTTCTIFSHRFCSAS